MHGKRVSALVILVAALVPLRQAVSAATPAPLQTVCTITVNSPDEKQSFRRHLPAARVRFVELVEPGRPDWLASACRAGVSCDVLIISGHYDGSNEFFSDRLESKDMLPVDEMERASCSASCPGLFSRLKEVHLFGCNTLNPQPQSSASEEIVRSLVREGRSLKQAQAHWQALSEGHGESSRERMRRVFKDVPVIYGFSSVAPLGPVAGATLEAFFRRHGSAEVGRGRASSRLLAQFAPFAMSSAAGITDADPQAGARHDVCRFTDERLQDAERLAFVHEVLQRDTAQARIHLDRIRRFVAALDDPARRTPAVLQALAQISDDIAARTRFLDFARDVERPEVRARMLGVARDLGWLTDEQRWQELALMLAELQGRSGIGIGEVALACQLNREHELDGAFNRRVAADAHDDVAHAAVRACLGSSEARQRTLAALLSPQAAEVLIAQAYLRQRPVTDAAELRQLAFAVARMTASDAQERALEALGRHYIDDREVLEMLARLFTQTRSWSVQAAVAGILLRADLRPIASPALLRRLRDSRLPSPPGDNMIDALMRRLRTP